MDTNRKQPSQDRLSYHRTCECKRQRLPRRLIQHFPSFNSRNPNSIQQTQPNEERGKQMKKTTQHSANKPNDRPDYTTKVYHVLKRRIINGEFPTTSRWKTTFFQGLTPIRTFPVKYVIQGNKVIFSPCHFEPKRSCFVTHVILFHDKTPMIRFSFTKKLILPKGENILMGNTKLTII